MANYTVTSTNYTPSSINSGQLVFFTVSGTNLTQVTSINVASVGNAVTWNPSTVTQFINPSATSLSFIATPTFANGAGGAGTAIQLTYAPPTIICDLVPASYISPPLGGDE